MRSCLVITLAAVASASAQIISVGMQPAPTAMPAATAKRVSAAGPPILGYVAAGGAELQAVTGKINAPQLGSPVSVPENTKALYLAPRQLFALVEKTSDEPLEIWALRAAATSDLKPAGIPLSGVMPHPDMVMFSPRGTAAALYSQTRASLQVINNLPGQPLLSRTLSVSGMGAPSQLAVSDDAALIVAAFSSGRLMSSLNGDSWHASPISFSPQAWLFLPGTHDLVVSDTTQKTIALLPNFQGSSGGTRVLAQDIAADRLTVTKGGEQLLAASLGSKQLWTIDVKSGAVLSKQEGATVDALTPLRDGFTFLLSTSPTVSVFRVSAAPELAALAPTQSAKQ